MLGAAPTGAGTASPRPAGSLGPPRANPFVRSPGQACPPCPAGNRPHVAPPVGSLHGHAAPAMGIASQHHPLLCGGTHGCCLLLSIFLRSLALSLGPSSRDLPRAKPRPGGGTEGAVGLGGGLWTPPCRWAGGHMCVFSKSAPLIVLTSALLADTIGRVRPGPASPLLAAYFKPVELRYY